MFAEPRLISLSQNRTLAVDEYGDANGEPVIYCHGWPSSRMQASGADAASRELGLRLISPDRPGIGLSSFQKNRRLLDWPPMLAEMLDKIGVEKFRIFGVSGGGPYALAAAWALPERVKAATIVCGAPPLFSPPKNRAAAMKTGNANGADDLKNLLFVYRWMLGVYRKNPRVIRALFRAARPLVTLKPPLWMWPWILRVLPMSDAGALRDAAVFEGSFLNYRESWRGSALGVVADAEIYAADWGFRPEEIRVPVRLWHGKDDRNFSWKLAESLARRIPNCASFFLENEGHYSLPIRRYAEILRDLKECVAARRAATISK